MSKCGAGKQEKCRDKLDIMLEKHTIQAAEHWQLNAWIASAYAICLLCFALVFSWDSTGFYRRHYRDRGRRCQDSVITAMKRNYYLDFAPSYRIYCQYIWKFMPIHNQVYTSFNSCKCSCKCNNNTVFLLVANRQLGFHQRLSGRCCWTALDVLLPEHLLILTDQELISCTFQGLNAKTDGTEVRGGWKLRSTWALKNCHVSFAFVYERPYL